ncbi:50S ribosomal protein L30 [Salibacteraceae bacterium]|jgi:large subunit ribosomal protein L30|nr:50S ribosomal protein L30 [Salibacteraceae bacterium]MDB9709807.1 50S ribosomal protein L30 [Salibacteraceae bacterium]MDC1305272.1 50S ribosomal protein L30 [Salibacteraceae bacterium]HAQ70822.1 50S ribosomal protein L30 [Flavobacteriales bacterium]
MEKFKLTLVRSIIKRPGAQKATIAALGLKRMNSTVEVVGTPQIMGMIKKVNHLLKVEDVK